MVFFTTHMEIFLNTPLSMLFPSSWIIEYLGIFDIKLPSLFASQIWLTATKNKWFFSIYFNFILFFTVITLDYQQINTLKELGMNKLFVWKKTIKTTELVRPNLSIEICKKKTAAWKDKTDNNRKKKHMAP